MDIFTKKASIIAPLIAGIAIISTIVPLMQQGYFPLHDDVQIERVVVMNDALREGQFPVRIVSDLGYNFGYPLFNFYSPLPYYIGAMFTTIGLSPLIATKIMMGLGMLFAGVSMYLLASRLWGHYAGMISSVAYQLAPYHAIQLYVRGAVGEMYAYGMMPLVLYGIVRRNIWIVSISYAALILSHNITALIFTGYILCMGIIVYASRMWSIRSIRIHIAGIVLGLGIAAFFWLPAFVEKGFTSVDMITLGGSDFHQHFLYIDQLWDSPWGFAGSAPGRADGMSFKIGKLHIFLGIIGLLTFFWHVRHQKKTKNSYIWMCIGLGILVSAIGMTIGLSVPLWEQVPLLAFVQFPWRFLGYILIIASLMSGGIGYRVQHTLKAGLTIGSALLLIFINAKYFVPQMSIDVPRSEYESKESIRFTKSKISDEYLPMDTMRPDRYDDIPASVLVLPEGTVTITEEKAHRIQAVIHAPEQSVATLHKADFPTWSVSIDQHPVRTHPLDGFITFDVPAGVHRIDIQFKNTPVRSVANVLSIMSIGIFFGTMFRLGRTYGKNTR